MPGKLEQDPIRNPWTVRRTFWAFPNTKHINIYTSKALISGNFGKEALTLVEMVVIVSTVVIPSDTRAAVAS